MRYHIVLAYKGTPYNGWQKQQNAVSVQQTLETALEMLLGQPIATTGCGRTDTGVHSSRYVAHFEYDGLRQLDKDFIYHLNSCLPKEIAVFEIFPSEKHARFDALQREYKYFISRRKDPFTLDQSWQLTVELDYWAMQQAADKLLIYSDFTSFARMGSDNKTNICRISCAQWLEDADCYVFTIIADRFLRGMVRAIVGTLIDVGRGKISPEGFAAIIQAQNRTKASSAAPAQGLILTKISY